MSDLIYLGHLFHVKRITESALLFLAVPSCRYACLDINHLLSCLIAEAVAEWCGDAPPS